MERHTEIPESRFSGKLTETTRNLKRKVTDALWKWLWYFVCTQQKCKLAVGNLFFLPCFWSQKPEHWFWSHGLQSFPTHLPLSPNMSVEVPPPHSNLGLMPGDHPSDTIKANSRSVEDAHGQLIAYLKTTARNTIIADILTLSGTITSIEDDFATVASRLTILDEKNIVPDKFAPEWKKLHDVRRFFHRSMCMVHLTPFIQEYTTLMRESQRCATDVSDKIDGRFLEYSCASICDLTFQPLQVLSRMLFLFLKWPYLWMKSKAC